MEAVTSARTYWSRTELHCEIGSLQGLMWKLGDCQLYICDIRIYIYLPEFKHLPSHIILVTMTTRSIHTHTRMHARMRTHTHTNMGLLDYVDFCSMAAILTNDFWC